MSYFSPQRPIIGAVREVKYQEYGHLFEFYQSHQRGILFFVAVELDGLAVVSHFVEGLTDKLLFFFGDSTAHPLDLIVSGRAEARHDFEPDTAQVAGAHVVVDMGDAPREAFLTVGFVERTRLRAGYHGGVGQGEPIPLAIGELLVGKVAHTVGCLFAVAAGTMHEFVFQLLVFFLSHHIVLLNVCTK